MSISSMTSCGLPNGVTGRCILSGNESTNEGANHLETPYLFNHLQDPKEETDVNATQGWVRGPIRKMINAFQSSLEQGAPIPPGAPDEYVPQTLGSD